MWKLSTTIKGVRAQPQTVLRVTGLAKGRKAHPGKPSHSHHQLRDADHARTHAHAATAHVADSNPRLRAAVDRHPHKQDGTSKAARPASKSGTVHRWHIPSHVVRHKIKPAPNGQPHARNPDHAAPAHAADSGSRVRAAVDRHPHKQDGTSKVARHSPKADTVHRWHIPNHAVRHKIKSAQHAVVRTPEPRGARALAPAPARHPHRPDLPERITAHPGDVLREEFLKPVGLSVNGLAAELCVPANRIGAIIKGERSVTADTALRLGRYFRTSPEFWMNLQSMHDLTRARLEWGHLIEYSVRPRR